jgi:hypothetical protein
MALEEEAVLSFEQGERLTIGQYKHTDYAFKTPATKMEGEASAEEAG